MTSSHFFVLVLLLVTVLLITVKKLRRLSEGIQEWTKAGRPYLVF